MATRDMDARIQFTHSANLLSMKVSTGARCVYESRMPKTHRRGISRTKGR
jgi:hypothetical protein